MLALQNISHTYPNGLHVLDAFSLHVKQGEFVAVVGPSGCGKSTLLRIACGLIQPGAGHVLLDNKAVTAPTTRVGMMFQEPVLLPWRTVAQNVGLPTEINPNTTAPTVASLLALVGLADFAHAYPRELSGGMAQRAALARALMTQPPVLLLDEPFGALDAFTREALTQSLEAICRKQNTTVLFVTHNINEAVFLADRIVVCSPRPATVLDQIEINLPRPRLWAMERHSVFSEAIYSVRQAMMNRV